MKKLFYIVALLGGAILCIVFLVNIFSKDTWQGIYYPNGCLTCENQYIWSPEFKDSTSCLDWIDDLQQQRNNSEDTFECGKNCKSKNGLLICEETI